MSSLEEIGSLLGLAAFVGLAVLVFLTFQQARHLRRLRDWAGRAPERAAAEAAARDAAREAGEELPEDYDPDEEGDYDGVEFPQEERPPRFAATREAMADWWGGFDRRSPVEPRLLLGGIAAVLLGVAIATSGFGLFGGDSPTETVAKEQSKGGGKGGSGSGGSENKPAKVAVLNATAPEGGVGVPGIADRLSAEVEAAGFRVGAVDNAVSMPASVVMFKGDAEADAEDLADALEGSLGPTTVVEMTPEIEAVADGADLAVVVGQDDAAI